MFFSRIDKNHALKAVLLCSTWVGSRFNLHAVMNDQAYDRTKRFIKLCEGRNSEYAEKVGPL
jgi:hypothetical protein